MIQRSILFQVILWSSALLFFPAGNSKAEELLTKTGKPIFPREESIMETTPVYWQGRAVLFGSIRLGGSTHTPDMLALRIVDLETGEVLATFGKGCSLGCAYVENRPDGDVFHVFAARQPEGETWFRDIIHFSSRDLQNWDESTAVFSDNEHLLNSSVCRDGDEYIMAYESDQPVGFCFKFAKSRDLVHWEKVADTFYAGPDGKSYSACPMIRRCGDYYYVIYLRNYGNEYFSDLIRSKDLVTWEQSPMNPILAPEGEEGINNSDVDLFEQDGKVRLVYATGDQQTWCDVRDAYFNGTMEEFFAACFPEKENTEAAFGENLYTGDEKDRTNIYVSKLGDNTDGKTWETAFNSITEAIASIPDTQGGYRVVVRPDTYYEANLLPAFPGAKGNYNELVGDFDGRYGGGAAGWVYVDASDQEKGFKSYDWYSIIRAYEKGWSSEHTGETISSHQWDRWIVRYLYVTGSDAGLFWDCLTETDPFTILVEDCVSIGRAFGIGVAFGNTDTTNPTTRADEPICFRRTWACSLDRWGDAGALFFRSRSPEISPVPEIYLDDCTLVSPDNAVENNCAEYDGSTHVALKKCRLLVMNFTQSVGNPPCTGIIRTPNDGSRYLVDLEDCRLMGCKVFSDEQPNPPQYTLKGKNEVYIQYQFPIPEGFIPMRGWPVDLFQYMAPPKEPK